MDLETSFKVPEIIQFYMDENKKLPTYLRNFN